MAHEARTDYAMLLGLLPAGAWRVNPGLFRIHVGRPILPGHYEDLELLREAAQDAVKALVAKG